MLLLLQESSCNISLAAAAASSAVALGSEDHEDVVVAAAALRVAAAAAAVALPDVVVLVNIDSLARRAGDDGTPGGCVVDRVQVAVAVVVVVAAVGGGGGDNVESPSELQHGWNARVGVEDAADTNGGGHGVGGVAVVAAGNDCCSAPGPFEDGNSDDGLVPCQTTNHDVHFYL